MIIECNGLPGSGKTFLIDTLFKHYQDLGIPCKLVGVRQFRDKETGKGKIRFYIKRIVPLLFHPLKLIGVVFPAKRAKQYPFFTIRERVISLIYYMYLIDEYKKTNGLILSDEGIVQILTTLSEFSCIPISLYKEADSFLRNRDRLGIDCELTKEEVIRRIKKRGRKDSAIDYLDQTELERYLDLYYHDLTVIRKRQSFHIQVYMQEPTEELVNRIREKMERIK